MMQWPVAAFLAGFYALSLSGCVTPKADYDQLAERYEQAQSVNHQLQSENQALQAQLGQPQQSTYTVAGDMLFPVGSLELTASGRAALNDIAARLKLLKNAKIVVYGYTDDQTPGDSFKKQGITTNQELSTRRADAVMKYLAAQGISPGVMSAKGGGDSRPVASNSTATGRAQNRRVEIAVGSAGS